MYKDLGKFVKMRRLEMGLSLREFGKLCDMSHTHIDSIEKGFDVRTGRAVNLTSATISKLAKALGVDERELVGAPIDKGVFITDDILKAALFGTKDIPDDALFEVKQYAQFIKTRYNGGK